jgi:hypothetical protein
MISIISLFIKAELSFLSLLLLYLYSLRASFTDIKNTRNKSKEKDPRGKDISGSRK